MFVLIDTFETKKIGCLAAVFKKVFKNCRKDVFGWAFFLLAVPYLPVHGRLCIVYAGEFMLSSNAAYFVALSWPTPFGKIVFAQIYLKFMLRPPSVYTIQFKTDSNTINIFVIFSFSCC